METLAQQLQDALNAQGLTAPVYLGSEYLTRETELPLVVMVPGRATYGPSDGSKPDALATGTTEVALICKAVLYEEAVALADLCYVALGVGKTASTELRSEVWGDYAVRVADLTITFPTTLTRTDITRMQVMTFTQHAQFIPRPTSTPEVPDAGTQGQTQFDDSAP